MRTALFAYGPILVGICVLIHGRLTWGRSWRDFSPIWAKVNATVELRKRNRELELYAALAMLLLLACAAVVWEFPVLHTLAASLFVPLWLLAIGIMRADRKLRRVLAARNAPHASRGSGRAGPQYHW